MKKIVIAAISCALFLSSFCFQVSSKSSKKLDAIKAQLEGSWEVFDPISGFVFAVFTVDELEKNKPGYKFYVDYQRIEEEAEKVSSIGYLLGKSLIFNINKQEGHYSYLFKIKKNKEEAQGIELYREGLETNAKAYSIRKVPEGQGSDHPIPPEEEFEQEPSAVSRRLLRKINKLNKKINGEWLASSQTENGSRVSKLTIKQTRYSFVKSHPVEIVFDYQSMTTGELITDLLAYKVGKNIFMNVPSSEGDIDFCFEIKSKKGLITIDEITSTAVFEKAK